MRSGVVFLLGCFDVFRDLIIDDCGSWVMFVSGSALILCNRLDFLARCI